MLDSKNNGPSPLSLKLLTLAPQIRSDSLRFVAQSVLHFEPEKQWTLA